ncbi:MAG: hypothetical protein V1724_04385 [Chloroflexota bacterium]
MTTPKTYQIEVSSPYLNHIEVEPNHYAKRTFVDVSLLAIGFRATLELQPDDKLEAKLKEAIKQALSSYLLSNTTRIIEVIL